MADELTFGELTVRIGGSPPVYDPGGSTCICIGPGTADDFVQAESAARELGAAQMVVPKGDGAVVLSLGFEAMSDFWRGAQSEEIGAICATKHDLDFMLDLAEQRRAEYALVQPVFWRPAQDAREKQRAWFEHLMTRDDVRVLCDPDGFLIATPEGEGWAVDDFVVESDAHWAGGGRNLLMALDGVVTVVCGCHDESKQALLESLGFAPAFSWFQKTLA